MGLYNYNEDIFSGFQVPEEMDRETAIEEIVMQCAELELIYPSYTVMKLAIRNWTKAELPIWIRAYRDMTIEYNPIWNVDGTETETIERSLSGNVKDDNISTANVNGSESNSGTSEEVISGSVGVETSGSDTETLSGKAYNQNNEATWTDREKNVKESSSTTDTTQDQTTTTTQNGSRENEESISGSDNRTIANTETETITTTRTRGGNIGVTMTQQMLNADLDMLPRLNPYQFIVDSFKNRFCLLVY